MVYCQVEIDKQDIREINCPLSQALGLHLHFLKDGRPLGYNGCYCCSKTPYLVYDRPRRKLVASLKSIEHCCFPFDISPMHGHSLPRPAGVMVFFSNRSFCMLLVPYLFPTVHGAGHCAHYLGYVFYLTDSFPFLFE